MPVVQVQFETDVFSILRKAPKEVAAEMRIAAAVVWYAQGRVSQGQAADLAGLNRNDFIDALATSGVSASQETLEDLDEVLARG